MSAKPTYQELQKKIQNLEQTAADLRKKEMSLREGYKELEEIFALSLDLLCILDMNSAIFLKINPAFSKILGYPDNGLLNRCFLDLIHPGDVGSTKAVINEKLNMGLKAINFTNRYRRTDGSYLWLEWTWHPIPERGITFGVGHDVTERKRTEAAIRESEAFVRTVMDNLPIGIAVNSVDPTVTFEYMNDNFPRLYRTTREALGGPDSFWEAVYEDPQFREEIRKRVLDDCATEDPARMYWEDVPITRKGQETTFITAMNIPIPDRKLMISVVWDVTHSKQAEAALRETKRLLEETQAISKLGGWEYDVAESRFTWTDEVYRIHGMTPGSGPLNFKEVMARYAPEHERKIDQAFRRAVEHGESYDLELELTRADGAPIWVRTMGQPVLRDGRVVRITGNIIDITERKRGEEDRRKLQAQLLQAQKMESIGRLAGGIAHDFNNMLGVILGNTEMALEELGPEHTVHAALEEIQKAARRSADLTRQLLAFARKQTVAPKILDLNAVVAGMLQMLRRLIGEEIDLDWKPGKPLWPVKIDPSQIDQILANLCVNARDAIAGVGKVSIETGNVVFDDDDFVDMVEIRTGEFVLLAVSDNGSGMDKEVIANLFEPFFTTKSTDRGTGLGLATVYGIVRQNRGFINVYSEPGQGTIFKIYLPRHKDDTETVAMKDRRPIQPDAHKGETILLVEDEPSILRMCRSMLEKLGYAVLTATSPGEAVRLAEGYAGEIHLVITDVIMPEMNGRTLVERLLPLYPRIKQLFMSGYTANVIAHHGVLEEGVNFIQKPFSQKDLAAMVRQVLGE